MREEKILKELSKSGGKERLVDLLLTFDIQDRAIVELVTYTMVREGNLALSRQGNDIVVTMLDQELAKPESRQSSPRAREHATDGTTKLVATIPVSLQSQLSKIDASILMTDAAFGNLIGQTNYTLKLSLPFPEEAAISRFSGQLGEAAGRHVKFKLLTRELLPSKRRDHTYLGLLKSVLRLWDIVVAHGDRESLEVRTFHQNFGLAGLDYVLQYESTHAKVLISDSSRAYIGSGELRINSLMNNFELGTLIEGGLARQVELLFDLIWNNGTPVTHIQLMKTVDWLTNPPEG